MTNYGIKEIWQKDRNILSIIWTDAVNSEVDVRSLRKLCPCALCKGNSPKTAMPRKLSSVGRYAVAVEFDDGHDSGYFTYQMLRDLGGGS